MFLEEVGWLCDRQSKARNVGRGVCRAGDQGPGGERLALQDYPEGLWREWDGAAFPGYRGPSPTGGSLHTALRSELEQKTQLMEEGDGQ